MKEKEVVEENEEEEGISKNPDILTSSHTYRHTDTVQFENRDHPAGHSAAGRPLQERGLGSTETAE